MILVTGATGHIGNVLIRKLVQRSEKVRALYWRGEKPVSLAGLDVELFPGDVLDKRSLHKAMEGVDFVFHLAGLISIMPPPNPLVWRVNVEGTRNVLEIARQEGIKRLVYTSSIHALRRVPHGYVIDETVGFDPKNPYGDYDRSKAIASLEVKRATQEGLDAVILCPTGVIGPYDFLHSEMGDLLKCAAVGLPVFYIDGAYDFVDVRDVADGLIAALEKGRCGECYILGGHKITIKYLLERVTKLTGKAVTCIKLPLMLAKLIASFAPYASRLFHSRPRLTPYAIAVLQSNCDISHQKATNELGFNPRPLSDTIKDTLKWFFEEQPYSVPSL